MEHCPQVAYVFVMELIRGKLIITREARCNAQTIPDELYTPIFLIVQVGHVAHEGRHFMLFSQERLQKWTIKRSFWERCWEMG
jgi:hypothetical protein